MSIRRPYAVLAATALLACGGKESPPVAPSAPVTPTTPTTPTTPVTPLAQVDVTVAPDSDRVPISPYVYGSNQDDGSNAWTVRRSGGNRSTGYNWETNASNAGSDYLHNSDYFAISNAGLPASDAAIPARVVTYFHDQSLAMGAQSIVTLQLAGYVAADANGPVLPSETAPSPRWVRVEPRKNAPFTTTPSRTDGVVYMDEFVSYLVQRYGSAASARGVRWYSLDNEPALWPSTHPRIHPQPTGVDELVQRSVALASAVKDVDPSARILGPALYGIAAYVSLQDAPDWTRSKGSYDWFVDYYLDRMRAAEATAGRRLLDVLDVHWYPEARGDHRITDDAATTPNDVAARLQAPRTLWDSTYHETSWITQALPAFLPILPRLKRAIDRYYPGTQLAISEYDYGGGATISGGLAQADVLGIFGRYGVDIATRWGIRTTDAYASTAFKLFRDYDGRRGAFGGTAVRVRTSDVARTSAYASIDAADAAVLHLILLNKDVRDTLAVRIRTAGGAPYGGGEAWGFDATSPRITARPAPPAASGDAFTYTVPPLTALHLVLPRAR